jgi:hypothetical protein
VPISIERRPEESYQSIPYQERETVYTNFVDYLYINFFISSPCLQSEKSNININIIDVSDDHRDRSGEFSQQPFSDLLSNSNNTTCAIYWYGDVRDRRHTTHAFPNLSFFVSI